MYWFPQLQWSKFGTRLRKQRPEVFYKKAVVKELATKNSNSQKNTSVWVSFVQNTAISLKSTFWKTSANERLFLKMWSWNCEKKCSKSVPLEIIGWFFPPEPANFSASDKPGLEFLRVWESPEKNKNLKLIKIAENGNRAKRKCHTNLFIWEF